MFDPASFNSDLKTGWLGRRFWYYQKLDSTNRFIQELPAGRLTHGLVCLADEQTHGKGQFGRTWNSIPGKNLTFTLVLKPRRNTGLQLFSMAAMLALKEKVQEIIPAPVVIKWPNDLLISGKKAAGLLTESRYNGKSLDRLLLGLGINVNQTGFHEDFATGAVSLIHHHPKAVDRERFLAGLLNHMEQALDRAENSDLDLVRSINRSIEGYGDRVVIQVNGVRMDQPVKILGINEFGYLMVLNAHDDILTFTHQQVRIDMNYAHPCASDGRVSGLQVDS